MRATRVERASPGWKPGVLPIGRRQHIVKEPDDVATAAGVEPAGLGFGDRTSTTASRPWVGVGSRTPSGCFTGSWLAVHHSPTSNWSPDPDSNRARRPYKGHLRASARGLHWS